jgi:signal transduction histidine kinase
MAGNRRGRTALEPPGPKEGPLPRLARRRPAVLAEPPLPEPLNLSRQLRAENEQLREALAGVEQSVRRYADYYDNSPIAHLTLDRAGVIREANQMACALLQRQRPELLGTLFRRWLVAADRPALALHLSQGRTRGEARTRLQLGARRDGDDDVPVEIISRRAAGERECYPTAIIDLSEWHGVSREREVLLITARDALERAHERNQFFAMISHELRAPLTPLLAAVATLHGREPEDEETARLYEMIRHNVKLQARLIDDLLDATRLARGKLTIERAPTELHRVVRGALDMFADEIAASQLQTKVELQAADDRVDGDATRLGQVFVNLIKNAVKFTPPGGGLWVRSWNHDGAIAVEVRDSGIGIAAAAMERLFLPFEQLGDPRRGVDAGLGLGLAIVRGIVEGHDGRASAASNGPGQGARFVVEFPLLAATRRTPGPRGSAVPARILLVEDNRDTAEALTMALGPFGHRVQAVGSAAKALQADLATVDLVISDLRLPDGDGRTLLRELRKKSALPAIALSGYGGEDDERASREAGFFAHLTKPIDVEILAAVIQRALARKRDR